MTIKQQKIYIDGQFVDHLGDKWIEVLNPSTEGVISRVPDAGVEDVRSAIDSVEHAQEAWEELRHRSAASGCIKSRRVFAPVRKR